jgi:hypothetical protein
MEPVIVDAQRDFKLEPRVDFANILMIQRPSKWDVFRLVQHCTKAASSFRRSGQIAPCGIRVESSRVQRSFLSGIYQSL